VSKLGDAALYCDLARPSHLADQLFALMYSRRVRDRLTNVGSGLAAELANIDCAEKLNHVFDRYAYLRRHWAWPEQNRHSRMQSCSNSSSTDRPKSFDRKGGIDEALTRRDAALEGAHGRVKRFTRAAARLAKDTYNYLTFPRRPSQFRGVFENFEQAEAAIPRGGKLGYNYQELAQQYRANLDLRLESFDYPILFHLERIVAQCHTVLDFGGNIGIHYLRYRRYLNLETIKWIVLDFPAIAAVGRETCANLSGIEFINDIAELKEPRIDVLLASGSMQYVASPNDLLQQIIDRSSQPKHILINQLPLYDGPLFVTLQNGGLVYYPQYVFNRKEYIGTITSLGYNLIDSWPDTEDRCIIPFNRDKSLETYTGLYFSKADSERFP
jgi:putative methyltransferase (TIGR04325 family)